MKASKEFSDNLKKIGIGDDEKDLDNLIPVKKGKWNLRVEKHNNPKVGEITVVDYVSDSDDEVHPVAFAMKNPADAKAYMVMWLRERGEI